MDWITGCSAHPALKFGQVAIVASPQTASRSRDNLAEYFSDSKRSKQAGEKPRIQQPVPGTRERHENEKACDQ